MSSLASASTPSAVVQGPLKVDDVMTKKTLYSVREDTSIDEGAHSEHCQQKVFKQRSILTSKHARSAALVNVPLMYMPELISMPVGLL